MPRERTGSALRQRTDARGGTGTLAARGTNSSTTSRTDGKILALVPAQTGSGRFACRLTHLAHHDRCGRQYCRGTDPAGGSPARFGRAGRERKTLELLSRAGTGDASERVGGTSLPGIGRDYSCGANETIVGTAQRSHCLARADGSGKAA